MSNNNSYGLMPRLVVPVDGAERRLEYITGIDSGAYFLGSFVANIITSAAAPNGSPGGIAVMGDDKLIYGIAVGFQRNNSSIPIWNDPDKVGTVTNITGQIPAKYTFGSSNDEVNTTPTLEKVVVLPLKIGDILEIPLWGASTIPVVRGTTVAAGTADSTANIGTGLAVDTTYTFAVLESGGDEDLENKDFITTKVKGKHPKNPYMVYAQLIRSGSTFVVPD